jgi:protein-tyrosine phosphatase
VIDLHSHILPGLDDGARDLDDALEIARAAVPDGIKTIAATPHVREDYPTTSDAMENGVRQLRTAFEPEHIELELWPAGSFRSNNSTASRTTSYCASRSAATRGICSSRPQ